MTNKIFSLFDKCKIDGSNKYDNVGDKPNKLKSLITPLKNETTYNEVIAKRRPRDP